MLKNKFVKIILLVLLCVFLIRFFVFLDRESVDYGQGEEDVLISENQSLNSGTYEYKSLILDNAILTVDTSQGELILIAQESITIKEDAIIDVSEKGYPALDKDSESRDFAGLSFDLAGGGGSHGGSGGYGSCIDTSSSEKYGFQDRGISFGEGGGMGLKMDGGFGGFGGGFVKLIAPKIILDGTILSNGGDGEENGGGGAGGKIVLIAEEIIFNGLIEANGGMGGTSLFQGAGGGGGGVVFFSIAFEGDGIVSVYGGQAGKATDYYSGCHGGDGEKGVFIPGK